MEKGTTINDLGHRENFRNEFFPREPLPYEYLFFPGEGPPIFFHPPPLNH